MSDYWCVPRRQPLWHRLRVEIRANGSGSITAVDDVGECTGFTAAAGMWLVQKALAEYLDGTYVDVEPQPPETPPPAAPSNMLPFVAPRASEPTPPTFPPSNYYAQPHWHQHAAAVRREWGYTCALNVRHRGPVEVHHRTYENIGHEEPYDCVPLCETCHELVHGRLLTPRVLDFAKKAA